MSSPRPVFYVSDGTGITAETIGHSLLTQFTGTQFSTNRIPFVDSMDRAREVAALIRARGEAMGTRPIVISSCVDPGLATVARGKVREGNYGWEDLWAYASHEAGDSAEALQRGGTPKVPDGTTITQWLMDDTLPGGPREVQRTYTAPFARASREDDYRVAWAFFEGRQS